jgi:hypothetical protein
MRQVITLLATLAFLAASLAVAAHAQECGRSPAVANLIASATGEEWTVTLLNERQTQLVIAEENTTDDADVFEPGQVDQVYVAVHEGVDFAYFIFAKDGCAVGHGMLKTDLSIYRKVMGTPA